MMQRDTTKLSRLSRRELLKSLGVAPLLLRSSAFWGEPMAGRSGSDLNAAMGTAGGIGSAPPFTFDDARFKPHYPSPSPLAEVLSRVQPGSDEYVTEAYAYAIGAQLKQWGDSLRRSVQEVSSLAPMLSNELDASPMKPIHTATLRSGFGLEATRVGFAPAAACTREQLLDELKFWLQGMERLHVTEFDIFDIAVVMPSPLTVAITLRYDVVGTRGDSLREERVGAWKLACTQQESGAWLIHRWEATEETRSVGSQIGFVDVTQVALGHAVSYREQMLHGVDHWRSVLDGASGIDIYANNGVATGDYDNDGFDDIYVCQPAGLPNRLYRNRGDGTFEDVTEKAGVAVLDNTACALFADFDNRGLQDLLVVCGSGPMLFQNRGDGTFQLKSDAFQFTQPPTGTFTHASIADYDGDGRLDIYLCTYMYYLGLDQYHYPVPYFDARNGPPNCLFHNEGGGRFVETTAAVGMNVQNNRYSFACAWGYSNANGLPDLCIANDFGTSQLYRNRGDGTFSFASKDSHIEDVGAGMSACWADVNNDGNADIYITSMWEASGQRVSGQAIFHEGAPNDIRALYQRHARGNALYKNNRDGTFANVGQQAGVAMGRWSWSADFWDIDHDGYADLYVTNGYISAPEVDDIASFFWRQVVAKSPDAATSALAYEHGWNAINELVRSDYSWNGHERNVMFANNRDGTFTEVSGVVGLDCIEDGRSFALADIDHDGRLEVIVKNRDAPQLRILRNAIEGIGASIVFRLRGHKSNRDAIGAAITVQCGPLQQTRYLQAGTGFLAQHSKEVFFGLGESEAPITASVRWPSGFVQRFEALPKNRRIELEEGVPTFAVKEFETTPKEYLRSETSVKQVVLPTNIETWLITPLKAPAFTLTDVHGATRSLDEFTAEPLLLFFWESASPLCREQLRHLQAHATTLRSAKLTVLAINVDDSRSMAAAHKVVADEAITFPVLFATEEVAGIYNIIFRYLYDRRRNLALPTSFLLDRGGDIVKVYQGVADAERVLADAQRAPVTAEERVKRALPFSGTRHQGTFQRNDFTYGVALFQYGYLDQAAESFEQVVRQRPDDPEACYNLGTLNLRRGDFKQARQYLERTLQLKPDYPEAWNNLGMMSAQAGDATTAIGNFQQALHLRPDYEIALMNLGNVYRRQGAFAQAEESLGKALAIQPDDPEVNYNLGMLHAQQNQLQQAADFLQKAITLRSDYPEALNNLGIVYVRSQSLDKAEQQFKTAITVAPDNDQAYLNLARLYMMREDSGAAREALQQLLQRKPGDAAALKAMDALR